jgi:hypothetical protein
VHVTSASLISSAGLGLVSVGVGEVHVEFGKVSVAVRVSQGMVDGHPEVALRSGVKGCGFMTRPGAAEASGVTRALRPAVPRLMRDFVIGVMRSFALTYCDDSV